MLTEPLRLSRTGAGLLRGGGRRSSISKFGLALAFARVFRLELLFDQANELCHVKKEDE